MIVSVVKLVVVVGLYSVLVVFVVSVVDSHTLVYLVIVYVALTSIISNHLTEHTLTDPKIIPLNL